MAKVYLFRKLTAPNETQKAIYEEAVGSVIEHVLNGNSASILNCGKWPKYVNGADIGGDAANLNKDTISRILCEIFRRVYTMELSMEINISVKYVLLDIMQQQTMQDIYEQGLKNVREHFVSTPLDVYTYMDTHIKNFSEHEHSSNLYLLFSIKVSQANMDYNKRLYGRLNLFYFDDCHDAVEDCANSCSPMWSLVKILSALGKHCKTHMLYQNIRLTRTLKDIMGEQDTTVLINYASNPPPESTVELWKARFEREHHNYCCLKDKLLNLTCWHETDEQAQKLQQFVDSLENESSNADADVAIDLLDADGCANAKHMKLTTEIEQLYLQLHQKDLELKRNYELCRQIVHRFDEHEQIFTEQSQLLAEVQQIRTEANESVSELQALHQLLQQLLVDHGRKALLLEQKDDMLQRFNRLVADSNEQLLHQKLAHRQKLSEYSDMFNRLWRQQASALQTQEEQRERQLSDMFDTICKELHSSYQAQLAKLKLQANENENELLELRQQQLQQVTANKPSASSSSDVSRITKLKLKQNKLSSNTKKKSK